MRIFIFLFFVTISSFSAVAQRGPVDIQFGEEYKEPRNSGLSDFIGSDETGFYALRSGYGSGVLFNREGKIFIEKYNSKMKLVKSTMVKLEYKKKQLRYEDLKMINGEFVLFSSYKNRKKKTSYLFAQTISKKSLKPKNNLRIVSSIPTRRVNEGSFNLEFSRDSSKILVMGNLPYQANKSEKYNITVLDKNLEEVWTEEVVLPYSDIDFITKKFRVDNSGNVYILGQLITKRNTGIFSRQRPSDFEYRLIAYTPENSKGQEYKIRLKDKFITDLTFRINRDGNIVCAGFYSDKGTRSVRGTYYLRLDKDSGDIVSQGIKEFEFEFITELLSERGKRKAERQENSGNERRQPELFEYDLDKLILRSDGGAVLVAEQYYVQVRTNRTRDLNTGLWNNVNEYIYHYNDIIVVNINPSGEIDWSVHVPKRQVTRNDGGYYSSYAISVTNKAIYLVYNENGRNFNSDREAHKIYSFNGTRSVVALTEIKPNGEVSTYPLFSNREEGLLTRPKICKQTDGDEMVIYSERRRKYKFSKVSFK